MEAKNDIFSLENFNSKEYVNKIVKDIVTGSELYDYKEKLLNERSEISIKIKSCVFKDYSKFIETSKEISHLESEMYQLSHILSDQKNLIELIKEESLLDDPKQIIITEKEDLNNEQSQEDQNQRALKTIKEAMSNYTKSLNDKVFIHEGSLLELDANDYRPICRSHLFLFNDILIIAKVKHDKKLEFMEEYETKKLAVVNIKELTGVKNAMNLITNDGSRIYQTINDKAKSEWIEKFEIAIKFHQTGNLKIKSKKGPAPQPPKIEREDSVVSLPPPTPEKLLPEWLYSSTEEIQSEIAQRHFEECFMIIQKCEDFIKKNPNASGINEISEKTKSLKKHLTDVLLHELSITKNRNLQSVLKSSKRSLKILVEMGKSREASAIFLKISTVALRLSQKNSRRNNLPISELFFCDLAQIASEFLRIFSSNEGCISALIVWSNDELNYFAQNIMKHFLTKGTNLETVASIVESIREPCSRLTEIGLDLSYYLEGLLRTHLEMLLEESRIRIIDNITRLEENWLPYNLLSKSNMRSFIKDFKEKTTIDLSSSGLVTGETYISLTQCTLQFCQHYLKVTESCAIIAKNIVLKPLCEKVMIDFFQVQYNLKPSTTSSAVDPNFVVKNKAFILDVLLPVAISRFESISKNSCTELKEIQQKSTSKPQPKPRNIYKIDL